MLDPISVIVTLDDLDRWDACGRDDEGDTYSDERVLALTGGRSSLTLREVLALPVPPRDLVWLACHALDAETRQRWVERTVACAVTAHALHCGDAEVEAWAWAWLDGSDRSADAADSARAASARAAYGAAYAAAAAAYAYDAADAAYAFAADAAADAAAYAAAYAYDAADAHAARAARAAAAHAAAAREAEYRRQIADLLELT
jgi:hypothetical protein